MNKLVISPFVALIGLSSQPLFASARVAVLHLAPFAADIDDTGRNILVNGNTTFSNKESK